MLQCVTYQPLDCCSCLLLCPSTLWRTCTVPCTVTTNTPFTTNITTPHTHRNCQQYFHNYYFSFHLNVFYCEVTTPRWARSLEQNSVNNRWTPPDYWHRQFPWTGNGHLQLPLAELGKPSPNIDLLRKSQMVQTGERPQTNGQTHTHTHTRIISPAMRSITKRS